MEVHTVLVTGNICQDMEKLINADAYRQSFRFVKETEVSREDLQWADAYVAFKPTANFDFYGIKWVHSLGAGVDGYLFDREWKEDVLLTRTICSFGQRIGQYCLSYVLKNFQQHDNFLEKKLYRQWQPVTPELLDGRKILIYGTGEIGKQTAKLFSTVGTDVYGVSRSGKPQPEFTEVYPISAETKVLPEVDVVINTLPLTHATYHLFEESFFSKLTNAVFINVGRGASVVESALLEGVERGNIREAVLDVFEKEPLPVNSLLWNQKNVVITPHISAVTTAEEAVTCFLDTLKKVESNQPVPNRVDIKIGY